MSDRLSELLRQRAAIQAHLEWLDREIASTSPSQENKNPAQPTSPYIAPAPLPSTAPANTDADAILAGYRQNTQDLRTDVRKGCLIYFFGAILLLGLGIASLYFINRMFQPADRATPQSSAER